MAPIKELEEMTWNRKTDVDTSQRLQRRAEEVRRWTAQRRYCQDKRVPSHCPGNSAAPGDVVVSMRSMPIMTRHSLVRLSQRGIKMDQLVAVLDYGVEQRTHGASRYYLDNHAWARLAAEMPAALRSRQALNIQVVVSDDGAVITASHRTRRIRRDL